MTHHMTTMTHHAAEVGFHHVELRGGAAEALSCTQWSHRYDGHRAHCHELTMANDYRPESEAKAPYSAYRACHRRQ